MLNHKLRLPKSLRTVINLPVRKLLLRIRNKTRTKSCLLHLPPEVVVPKQSPENPEPGPHQFGLSR
ncbi:hypothetical protein BIW11_03515 [Tropilaelaps mercedesae]|uniref:Uncharacterized protein n=1 Tax=Tropilaelaps mercedesae TaxID=418985 RepID=A0A1V9XJQ3_9ACAR|nr:hypothetical protein BIW11_03515 [Tropilaelaps mercedesae]